MNILIVPTTRTLDKLTIASVNVSLDNSAIVSGLISGSESTIESFSLYMDPVTYAQWGTNDEFVVDWTCSQLGLQKA